ncbi:MAG TPA: hypothetical protein VJ836_03160 [Candidatus Saccharimonadales bacterium]|nr:hypothetical protein [Candidatus Saccharimonadales bacterium]
MDEKVDIPLDEGKELAGMPARLVFGTVRRHVEAVRTDQQERQIVSPAARPT